MADLELAGFDFAQGGPYSPRLSWPLHQNNARGTPQNANLKRSTTPLHPQAPTYDHSASQLQGIRPQYSGQSLPFQHSMNQQTRLPQQFRGQDPSYDGTLPLQYGVRAPFQSSNSAYDNPIAQSNSDQQQAQADMIPEWRVHQHNQQTRSQVQFPLEPQYSPQYPTEAYAMPYHTSPTEYMSSAPTQFDSTLVGSYLPLNTQLDGLPFEWQDFPNNLLNYPAAHSQPGMPVSQQNLPNSPTDTSLEVRSLSSSDNGWTSVDYTQLDGSYQDQQVGAIFNPGETLHGRTFSDSSYSDVEHQARLSWGSFVDVPQHAIGSPGSDSAGDVDFRYDQSDQNEEVKIKQEKQQPTPILTSSFTKPIKIKTSTSPQRSPIQRSPVSSGRTSPGRRQPKKNGHAKAAKATIRRQSQSIKADTEKRIGRRKGPLRPEQRKQASEIRKLGACLRCKFLKKTCDKGEPCEGCQPSHARLWHVPCTRIDIKEIAYFMRDWKADYERHVSLGFSIDNIKGFAKTERTLFITHGYGHLLPVRAREVFVRDERCFGLDWVETMADFPTEHSVNTAKLSAGMEGISTTLLSDYLDRHLDMQFPNFVDEYFEGTPFLTEMLKTAYTFWLREGTPVIRKSLKFLLAYNLTQHVTLVEGIPDEEGLLGKINDRTSKFNGKTIAPVMINFQVKIAMGNMWRELQKDILEELSHLYSSVYTKDKLRHWPTIFMVASILLAVWEEMQFDCHYRIPDKEVVSKFCTDMETIPVGVIVGLFAAISQKLPPLQEWDSNQHHHQLNSNPAVCNALTEVRQHVTRHDKYLRSRCDTTFDRNDFDSLSSKFTSKLVIRASAS